ncbi:MAG: hypothetical protein L0287_09955 [Anaerolineae bacterium]|nr:hypothetical protein [Anaerolineae bacterium]
MLATDEYPAWALPLLVRRMLWQQYGIAFLDYEFDDLLQAMRLNSLEVERSQFEARRNNTDL